MGHFHAILPMRRLSPLRVNANDCLTLKGVGLRGKGCKVGPCLAKFEVVYFLCYFLIFYRNLVFGKLATFQRSRLGSQG